MYGLEGILGNLVTSVATPAIGGITGDFFGSMVGDEAEKQLLKDITQTTTGALAGAGIGAGLGALTGGKSGALSGAITGGVGGGLGGYHAQDISQMFGTGSGAQPSQAAQVPPNSRAGLAALPGEPMPSQDELNKAANQASMEYQQQTGFNLPPSAMYDKTALSKPISDISPPPAPPASSSEYKGYMDFLKKNYEPLAGGFFLGSSYGSSQDTQEQAKKYKQQQALRKLIEDQQANQFAQSVYGYADGGAVNVGLANPQINVHFPAWAQEDIQREGGLAALQPGMANGGFINLQPQPQQGYYPMSQIAGAKPYPAATPQRSEVIQNLGNYAHGGLIDGPGDGMSDSIPANISGKEEVRVADGEYVVPRAIAEKLGPDKLKHMMAKVRAAAHAKKGKQIVQGAAQREFIKALTGVRA